MVEWPAAEVDIDERLVRSLLLDQHPDLADLPLVEAAAGFDNAMWRLGPDLAVRLPRRAFAVPFAEHEQRWLPELAPRLPLPIPAPVRAGGPTDAYPWPWSVVPWLSGTPADQAPLDDAAAPAAAATFGAFLRALHRPAPPDAPTHISRGIPLPRKVEAFDALATDLAAEIDVAAVRRAWDRGLAAPAHDGPATWLHGDLHPANVLVESGAISAVIDLGDVCAGDPATDLAGAWMLLPRPVWATFVEAYGAVDEALTARSEAWAALFALQFLDLGRAGQPTYTAVARRTLARLLTTDG